MNRLEIIDDVRKYANLLMIENPNMNYSEATKSAKVRLFGEEIDLLTYNFEEPKEEESNISYRDIASNELPDTIRVELYTDEQLKEIVIAKRMGVSVENFVNIFYTPLQIRVITIAAALGRDITPYTTNLYFDPEEEMRRLEESGGDTEENDKIYTLDKAS